MAERLCMACLRRRPQDELIPLSATSGGSCVVGQGPRTAWVCESSACIERLAARPGAASRSLKIRVNHSRDLAEQVMAWRASRHALWLSQARKSGLIRGSERAYEPEHGILARSRGADSSPADTDKSKGQTYTLATTPLQTTEYTGIPVGWYLVILPGRPTRRLIDSLRRW